MCGGGGGACVEHEHITVCTASRTDPGSHMQRCRYSACRDGAGWGRCTQELCWNGQVGEMLEYVLGGGGLGHRLDPQDGHVSVRAMKDRWVDAWLYSTGGCRDGTSRRVDASGAWEDIPCCDLCV